MLLLLAQAPAPAVPAAPPVSLGTALITGAALLIGVLITNFLQNRREGRTWERQLQLYADQWADQRERDAEDRTEQRRRDAEQREDQRKRDAEQREDQRERDGKAREREDRHRFSEHKREIYAEFLASHLRYSIALNQCKAAFDAENARRIAAEKPTISDRRAWLSSDQKAIYAPLDTGLDYARLEVIALVASDDISRKAIGVTQKVMKWELAAFGDGDEASIERLGQEYAELNHELRRLMQADLTDKTGRN